MVGTVTVSPADPAAPTARAMCAALWDELQRRYGFTAPNPLEAAAFAGPVGGFWVAADGGDPVGSIALTPLDGPAAELDVHVRRAGVPRTGVAQALLFALEGHVRAAGVDVLRLRAGEPQPEALRFYGKAGFRPIPAFGRWIGDDSARCFEKMIGQP